MARGRKRYTVEDLYNKTYLKELKRVQNIVGEEYSTVRKISFAEFKNAYKIEKMINGKVNTQKFTKEIIKSSRERTAKQASAQVKNIRNNIIKAKKLKRDKKPMTNVERMLAELDPNDFKYKDFYQGSAQVNFLEDLANENTWDEVFGS